MDVSKIEEKIDRAVAGATEISMEVGGIRFQSMMELFEMAKMMAVAQTAVPKHLRGNPGACLAVCIQALEWRMSPFAVANKSYEVNDRIAYESQLITAVINARAPLVSRLRYVYDGEGIEMKCTVSGLLKGEATPLDYESPQIKNIKVKNSPLWASDPRQQLAYYSSRAWARRHCPEVILGIYADDELDNDIGGDNIRDITPKPDIATRLSGAKGRGFNQDHVKTQIEHKPETAINTVPQAKVEPEPVTADTAKPAEVQMDLAAGDVETEIADKRRALQNADTESDLKELVGSATAFLKQHNRTDLLADLLSVASEREKQIGKKKAKAA